MKNGITVAGNILVDHNREIDQYPEHSSLATIDKIYNTLGGAVCNSGISLAKLDSNLSVNVLGVVGDDSDGKQILDEFAKYPNIDSSRINIGCLNTGFTDVFADMTNHTRTFFNYRGANSELSEKHFDFQKMDTDILHIGYVLLLDTLDEHDPEFGTKMAKVLHDAQVAGMKTSIDVVTEYSDRFQKIVPHAIKYTDYCIINEEEAARTVGAEIRDDSGKLLVDVCKKVCKQIFDIGTREWVIIHSREGGIGLDKEGNFVTKPSLQIGSEDIKGTTGAGDAFLAGALYGAWKGYSIEKAIELAIGTSNASIIEEGPTKGIKSEKEIWKFYKSMKKEDWPGFE